MNDERLNLKQVARRLGVHYMTAYRHVRQGRIEAVQEGGIWLIEPDAVEAFLTARREPVDTGPVDWAARLSTHLAAGDEIAAWTVLRAAADAGRTFEQLHLEVLGPAIALVGDERSEVSERIAIALAGRLVARLGGRITHRGRKLGTVALATPPGEHHGLALEIVANLLRQAGFRVVEIGTDASTAAVLEALERIDDPVALGLGVTTIEPLESARRLIEAIRAAHPGLPVLLGGRAVGSAEITELTGATAWANGPELVEVVLGLARDRARERRRITRSR